NHATALWETLLSATDPDRPVPAGLGARDTLRLEAGVGLHGPDVAEEGTPPEAGLGGVVQRGNGPLVGAAPRAPDAGARPRAQPAGRAGSPAPKGWTRHPGGGAIRYPPAERPSAP